MKYNSPPPPPPHHPASKFYPSRCFRQMDSYRLLVSPACEYYYIM